MAATAKLDSVVIAPQIFVDLETGNPSPERMAELVRQFELEWEPPGNLKDETKIEARRTADLAKFTEKAALLPDAPVRVVAVLADKLWQFHSMKRERARWEGSKTVVVEGFADEKSMLEATCSLLADVAGPDTLFVAHNAFAFDLPRLRLAFVRNGLALPPALQLKIADEDSQSRVFDTMTQFARRFLGQNGPGFVSQDAMLDSMGIRPLSNQNLTGADVPALLDAGKLDAVLLKNRADLLDLRKAFERMTGRT